MRTPQVKDFLIEHYMNDHTRKTAVMELGKPGIGKSISMYESAEEIAKRLDRELVKYSDQEGRRILKSDRDDFFVLNSIPLVSHESG